MAIAADVAWTGTDSRVVAMSLATPGAVPRVLEESAAVIWGRIAADGPLAHSTLLGRLSEVFGVEARDIRVHVDGLISELADLRLLTV
ncbi:hypothetical protein GCM10022383_06320 [Microbacterium soli]|uniref:PqqD family protein n=1 Tax=Microbacterium soli TaxID=446075 RepID=A0ABP7MUI1_9MICO